jgi:hypothetical protein
MNTFLSIANGALQYHRGRQTGASGIMGIAVALLVVFQWKRIYPVLKAWGVVDFFKRLGLVYEGEPGLTGFAIFMFIFKMTIVFSVVVLLLLAVAVLLSMIFSNEKIGLYVMLPILGILMIPYAIVLVLYQVIFNRKGMKANAERLEKERLLGTPQEQLLRDHSEEMTREQALARLNRIPTNGDNLFLLGVTDDNKMYMVLPRPINFENAIYNAGDLVAVQCLVGKYDKIKHKKTSQFEILPSLFKITFTHEKAEREIIPNERFVSFYQTNSIDMLNRIKAYSDHPAYYNDYVKGLQDEYFTKKETILNNMKNATEKTVFDNLVKRMAIFDASNEEIVEMMRDNEKQMQDKMEF